MTDHGSLGPPAGGQASSHVPRGASGALVRELLELTPAPAVVTRLDDHVVLAANAEAAALFGIDGADAVGRSALVHYVDPAARERFTDAVRQAGRADRIRLHARHPDGRTRCVLASARHIEFDGAAAAFILFSDISEHVATEAVLKESQQRLAAQSEALTALTVRHVSRRDSFSESLRTILSVAARTLQVERVSMWAFDETRDAIRCLGMTRLSSGAYDSGTVLRRQHTPAYFAALERERVIAASDARHDPRTSEFVATYLEPHDIGAMLDVPLRHDQEAVGVLCAEHVGTPREWTVDEQNFAISTANLIAVATVEEERRHALARVAASDALAHLIVETAHDAFVGMDADGNITTWNAQAERTFGWTREEAIGRSVADTIIPPAFRDAHRRGMERFLATGDAPVVDRRLELSALDRTGREFPVEITISPPMPREHGFFFGAFLRDISARREQEEQLRRARDSAEAATRAKSEFLASMSHELRTPLNGVLGYAQLLQRDRSLAPPHREAVEAISKCGAHLLELINDVLDLSKIEAGHVDIEESATNLGQLTRDLAYVLAETAHRKGLRLALDVAPDVPRRVVLDGRHLRQVLLNLLGNAIKFTAQGTVRLGVSRTGAGRLLFEVVDTGVGIEPQAMTAIFDAFTQTRGGATAGGTGLGLTISRHLVATMGDELRVESTLGKGSRFYFALPLVPAADGGAVDLDAASSAPLAMARVAAGTSITALVVDDSTVNRRILASLLESAGVGVITATGGVEALRAAREHRPDVIFMDLRLPDIDGLECTRRIKADAATAAIVVIAVTASAFGDTRQAALDAGCADYIPKPVRAEALFEALQTQLGVRFEADRVPPVDGTPELPDPAQRHEIAERLHEAAVIGDMTALEAIARDLEAGDVNERLLGGQVERLAAAFDFDGVQALARTLTEAGDGTRARHGVGAEAGPGVEPEP